MPQPNPTVARVAAHFGIPVDVLTGRHGKANIAYARHVAMYLLRQQGFAYLDCALALGRDCHDTALRGVRRIERELRYGNAETRHDVEALSKEA